MFVSKETKMTKIFLGDTLLWEEPENVIVHGETIPVKSIGITKSGVSNLVTNVKTNNTIYLGGDLNIPNQSKRYSYITPASSFNGTMILVLSTPTQMSSSNISGSFSLYESPYTYLIGNDIYTDAYRWINIFLLRNYDDNVKVTIDYTRKADVTRNDVYAAYACIEGLLPEEITVKDAESIVSSDEMIYKPSSKSSGVNRVYILGNLYSPTVEEPYNNWASSKKLPNIYNSKLAIYADSNTYSMMAPEFRLSEECATDGTHGADLPSVGKGIVLEFNV